MNEALNISAYEKHSKALDFKRTDAGSIPSDWDALRIRDVCSLINGRGFKPHEWRDVGLPIIRIQNLNGSGEFNYFDGNYNTKILVDDGQLLFAWSGSRGTSFGPHIWRGSQGLLNYHTWKVVPNPSKTDARFLFHALKQLTSFIEGQAHGASALVHTQKWEMEGFYLAAPKVGEQRAIAAALSDADELIGALDRLIAKKRAIKLATMQQLLTGKTRLPGFSGKWKTKRLNEIGEAIAGLTYAPDDVSSDGTLVLRASNISGSELNYRDNVYVEMDLPDRVFVKEGDILICVRNGSRDLIGKCAKIDRSAEAAGHVFGAFMSVFRTELHDFVFHQFQSDLIKKQIHEHLGATINQITNKSLNSFQIPIPPREEQIAIAKVLSDMDIEITSLEQRRDKTNAINQGMMQELLSGRTRLSVKG